MIEQLGVALEMFEIDGFGREMMAVSVRIDGDTHVRVYWLLKRWEERRRYSPFLVKVWSQYYCIAVVMVCDDGKIDDVARRMSLVEHALIFLHSIAAHDPHRRFEVWAVSFPPHAIRQRGTPPLPRASHISFIPHVYL